MIFHRSALAILLMINIHFVSAQGVAPASDTHPEDAVIWQLATAFTSLFNSRDTAAMRRFVPEGFMLQWMHDNCMGRNGLLNTMADTAVHASFRHLLQSDAQTAISYADDHRSATLNATTLFLDNRMLQLLQREKGYGLCIMYFQFLNNKWTLQTVHLDMHCSLCKLE
ncbi:MAG TPA: hypothetical protein VL307_04030 [Chitinophagaceae bacterium]|nr:hypothetical protein [Chitinophagaceae bacterium]